MRIAFVTSEYRTEEQSFDGGLANYLYAVAKSLLEFGHEPHIFVPGSPTECFTDAGVVVHRVPLGKLSPLRRIREGVNREKTPMAYFWLRLSQSIHQAVQEFHNSYPFSIIQYSSFGATGYYRVRGIPSVVRISSFEPLHRAARGTEEPTDDERRVEELEIKAMCRADAVFGPGKHTAEVVSRRIGRSVEIIESPFYSEESSSDDSVYNQNLIDKKYLLYFGTLWNLKGVDVIASILPELFARYEDLHFAFAGKDGGSLKNLLSAAQDDPGRLVYLGKLPHRTLYPIIRNAYAVVLPSLYDNFSNACVEAMGMGKIVIGTKQTSFEQLIEHGKSGLLVQPGEPVDLLEGIDRLVKLTEEERARLSRGAFERINELSPARVVQQLIDFYKRVIARKS